MTEFFRRLLLEPIGDWRRLILAFLLLGLVPTVVVLVVDIMIGGVGEPVGLEQLVWKMREIVLNGFYEELGLRAWPVVLYFVLTRVPGLKGQNEALSFLSGFLLVILVVSTGVWVFVHVHQRNPYFQLIQLIPSGLFYINLWRGVARISSPNEFLQKLWIVVAALLIHPCANILSGIFWQVARVVLT